MSRTHRGQPPRCIVIGSGPAGLTAVYDLSELGAAPTVLEADSVVGGIARTVEHNGYHLDIGGHRSFTKGRIIEEWWKNILQDEFQVRSKLSTHLS